MPNISLSKPANDTLLIDMDAQGQNSYGWDNIRGMRLGPSLENADSIAMTCLAAKLIREGYVITRSGAVRKPILGIF